MHSTRKWTVSAVILMLAASADGVRAAEARDSPLAGGPKAAARYPDLGKAKATYRFERGAPLPAERGSTARSVAASAASRAKLPAQFSVGEGVTTVVVPGPAQAPAVELRGEGGEPVTVEQPGATEEAGGARSLEALPAGARIVTLHPIAYDGVPLARGSDYLTIATADGRLLATRERALPSSVDATRATVPPDQAVAAARRDAGPALASGAASTPRLEVWVDGSGRGRLAWALELRGGSLEAPVARQYWVAAAGTPRVLTWESLVYHTQHGAVTGVAWPASPLAAVANSPLSSLNVTRGADTATTGEDGRYVFPAGAGTATLTATLNGPWCRVADSGGNPLVTASRSGAAGQQVDLHLVASGEPQTAQVTAFLWASAAHRLARLAATELPGLVTRVNLPSTCNAYWDGSSINFFKAGGGCPNTANADVILHEYGHGVDAVKGAILDGGYSEGFADALALLGTRQPCVGRDFSGAGTCLRRATDLVMWPPGPAEGVHAIGRRFAGFAWELVTQLQRTYGTDAAFQIAAQLVLGANAGNPASIPDAVRLAFIIDDTDGDLSTCSPHFAELAAAADSRHIPRPANCSAAVAVAGPGVSGNLTAGKRVAANANVLSARIRLDRPMQLHVVATSSAIPRSGAPTFRTGFLNSESPGAMWTASIRNVSTAAGAWVPFGSTFAVDLPAGDHTIYWKIWIAGGEVELGAGALLIQGFRPASPPASAAVASRSEAAPELVNR